MAEAAASRRRPPSTPARSGRRRRAGLAAALLSLPLSGCIEDRLAVDVTTYVHADGSCVRRVEYRLERIDGDSGRSLEIPAAEDPLRLLHRFPRGERWSLDDDIRPALHHVSVQASLESPNDADGDYFRQRAPSAPPSRNFVSFAMSTEPAGARYEYAETFLDPVAPLESAHALARLLQKREDDFAQRVARALGPAAPRRGDVKRAYRERFAQPFARELEGLLARPLYGPRERQQLEALVDRLEELDAQLVGALLAMSPVVAPRELEKKLQGVRAEFGEFLDRELLAAGLARPFDLAEPIPRLRFRVTLVMPAAITRANTCVQGDTAVWEFDQDDLFGRGFEMWAKAGGG